MEAIENYHAERIEECREIVRATAQDLTTETRLADPDRLPRVKSSRYRPDLEIPWVEGYDLLQRHPVWAPFEVVHTNYTRPLPEGSGCFLASTNGLASGNCESEAICHAICEVIERDALALAQAEDPSLNCISAPRLLLESVDDEACREVLARFRQAGLWTTVYDITSDLGIPCFFCRITEASEGAPPFCPKTEGFGCHSNREVALLRALTEAAQSRLTLISGSRDDLHDRYYPNESVDRGEAWEQLINPYSTRRRDSRIDKSAPKVWVS